MRGRLLLLVGVLASALVLPARLEAATSIQPGDGIFTSVGGCTLGFAATGGGNTYFMTAAHCVDRVGEDVEYVEDPITGESTVFGDVAVIGDADASATDWALIQVRPAFVGLVRGTVRGIPGTPTGSTTAGETNTGDLLQFSGHGVPFYPVQLLRENRFGAVVSDDNEMYTAIGMDSFGDSGGPVVHQASGEAYGLVSRLCIGVCTSEGPTIQGVLQKAAARGFELTLKRG